MPTEAASPRAMIAILLPNGGSLPPGLAGLGGALREGRAEGIPTSRDADFRRTLRGNHCRRRRPEARLGD